MRAANDDLDDMNDKSELLDDNDSEAEEIEELTEDPEETDKLTAKRKHELRRRIEDIKQQKELRRELDYLFDEEDEDIN